MPAGRPHNSKTPLWRNKAAVKVRIYRWLRLHDGLEESRSECAKMMEISRTTAIKWWDVVEWNEDLNKSFDKVIHWYNTHWDNLDYDQAAIELGRTVEDILLDVSTYKEMRWKYVWF